MPELRRSTRASTVEATKRLEQPPVKKAKTAAAPKKTETKNEDVTEKKEEVTEEKEEVAEEKEEVAEEKRGPKNGSKVF